MPETLKSRSEIRTIWWIVLVCGSVFGFTNGLYHYTWGPYFYMKFGGVQDPAQAMMLTQVIMVICSLTTVFEIPTGAIADTIGRVNVIILSWSFRMLFFVCLTVMWVFESVSPSFTFGILGTLAFIVGYTFFNGAFAAWGVDWLRENAPDIPYSWVSSRFYTYRSFSEIFGALIAIGCYIQGYPFLAFSLGAFVSFLGMAFCILKMREVKKLNFMEWRNVQATALLRRMGDVIGKSLRVGLGSPVVFWILLTYGSYMFLLNLVKYLWPVHLESKWGSGSISWIWIGLVAFSLLLTTASSRWLSWLTGRWSRKGGLDHHIRGLRNIFLAGGLLSSLPVFWLSWLTATDTSSLLVFSVVITLVTLNFGIIAPCFETLVNHFIPDHHAQERATIISAGSMIRGVLLGLLAIPSGGTSGEKSPIFWAIPAALLLVSTLFSWHFMRREAEGKVAAEGVADVAEV